MMTDALREAYADLDRIERHIRWAGAPTSSIRKVLDERALLTEAEIRFQRVAMAKAVIAAFTYAVKFGDTAEEALRTVALLLGLDVPPEEAR